MLLQCVIEMSEGNKVFKIENSCMARKSIKCYAAHIRTQGYAVDRNWLGLRALGSAQHRREKRRDGCLSVAVVRDCCAKCDLSLKNMFFSVKVVLNNPADN